MAMTIQLCLSCCSQSDSCRRRRHYCRRRRRGLQQQLLRQLSNGCDLDRENWVSWYFEVAVVVIVVAAAVATVVAVVCPVLLAAASLSRDEQNVNVARVVKFAAVGCHRKDVLLHHPQVDIHTLLRAGSLARTRVLQNHYYDYPRVGAVSTTILLEGWAVNGTTIGQATPRYQFYSQLFSSSQRARTPAVARF